MYQEKLRLSCAKTTQLDSPTPLVVYRTGDELAGSVGGSGALVSHDGIRRSS